MEKKRQKKGQVTIFIIIGLILLITAALVFYFVQVKETRPLEREAITPSMPMAEADPLSTFVTGCLKITAIEGLKIMGDQGGYLNKHFMTNYFEPTEGDAVQLGRGGISIPYWWHMSSPNSCQSDCNFESLRPELYSSRETNMETQLKNYVEENIKNCLNDFTGLKKQGFEIKENSEPKVKTKIRDKDIFLELDWKLTAVKQEDRYDIKKFAATVDLDIKEIYELATEITNNEMEYAFVENAVKELIYTFSRLDKDALPPVSDMTFESGGGVYWTKTQIRKKLQEMLLSYIPAFQVSKTKNYNYVAAPSNTRDSEMYELIYNRQFLIPLKEPHTDLEVRFYYLDWWKPYFDLNCDGEVCGPDNTGSNLIFSFMLQKYNFVYDVSIPVMVEITNPTALNGVGYSFRFMLEGNLRNNKPFKSDTTLPIPMELMETSIFCNPNQRTSGDVKIKLTDYASEKAIEGAEILYTCGEQTCAMGTTTVQDYESKFPRCMNGMMTISKLGYAPFYLPITMTDIGMNLDIKMFPEKELKINARKYQFVKEGRNWRLDTSQYYSISENEDLLIILEKQAKTFDSEYSTIADLSGGKDATVKLLPGKYKVSVTGFLKDEIKILKDKRCTKPEKFLFIEIVESKCYYAPEEDMIFNEENPFPSTIMEYEFEIKPNKLYKSNEILLTYFSTALDKVPEQNRKIEDVGQAVDQKDYAISNKAMLKPVLR